MSWYLKVVKENYANFKGRARRSEYWMFALFNFIISFVIGFAEGMMGSPMVLSTLYMLAVFIPSLAVSVRRLHDTGKSGWWLLIAFLPFIGGIVLLVFTCSDSSYGWNRFGENPKYPDQPKVDGMAAAE